MSNVITKENKDWNYIMFIDTVNTFKGCQGRYSRLARDLDEMTPEEKKKLKDDLAKLPKFNDTLDVVMWLEA